MAQQKEQSMNYLKDKKSWAIAVIESLGILVFNAIFVKGFYSALGENVSTSSVVIVSAVLFFLRVAWFYLNLMCRLFLEKRMDHD